MWDELPAPLDSYDLYQYGLRPPRCNGCEYLALKWKLGERFLALPRQGWTSVYELGATPLAGQGEPQEHEGRPIRFHASFMSTGHSDECWHFQAPDHPYVPQPRHTLGLTWRTRDGQVIPIGELTNSHLINILRFLERKDRFDRRRAAVRALIREALRRRVTLTTGEQVSLMSVALPDYKRTFDQVVFDVARGLLSHIRKEAK